MAPFVQVRQLIRSEEYKNGTWPISTPLFDNIDYGQRFAVEILKTPASVCQTHLTGIAANNGTQRKHFKERKHYEEFYDYVCRIMRCSLEHLGIHLPRSQGRWLLGNIGIGGVANQQGIESSHRWDRESIGCGHQV